MTDDPETKRRLAELEAEVAKSGAAIAVTAIIVMVLGFIGDP